MTSFAHGIIPASYGDASSGLVRGLDSRGFVMSRLSRLFPHSASHIAGPTSSSVESGSRVRVLAATPRLPEMGEVVAIRAESGRRLWVARVRSVGHGTLGVQTDNDFLRRAAKQLLRRGEHVHVSGFGGAPVQVRAVLRGYNGSILFLGDVEISELRPSRNLERLAVQGQVLYGHLGATEQHFLDAFDISLGGIALSPAPRARLGDEVSLRDPAHPERDPVWGIVVGRTEGPEGRAATHVAFLAGTPADAIADLIDGLRPIPTAEPIVVLCAETAGGSSREEANQR